MIDSVFDQSKKGPKPILLRHADREQFPPDEIGNDVPINKIGIDRSLAFGRSLREESLAKIFSSPLPRCVQTAEKISEGYGKTVEITECIELGNPGLHITDSVIAGTYYLKFGLDRMYEEYTSGNEIPGVSRPGELNEALLQFVWKNTSATGITLFITHDLLMALFLYANKGVIITKDNWIGYLDSIVVD